MNECVRKLLFGNQKQSLRQNEAVAHFVEEYLDAKNVRDQGELIQLIQDAVIAVAKKYDLHVEANLADKLFMEYIVGSDGLAAVEKGVPCSIKWKAVGDNGKVVFYLIPESGTETDEASSLNIAAMKLESKESKKAATKEDDAWVLINKMLSSIAPSMRAELPEDDRLAAILVSQGYWMTR